MYLQLLPKYLQLLYNVFTFDDRIFLCQALCLGEGQIVAEPEKEGE
jgi:hypothetical protein